MTDITIRKLAQDDVTQWTQLWAGYNAFYGRRGATALAREITETTWSRFFDPTEPVHALVAEHAGRLVGLAHYLLHRSTIQVQSNCYLQDLYTVEASRGLGVGRMLIGAVYDVARAWAYRACIGKPMRAMRWPCNSMTRSLTVVASSSTARCFDGRLRWTRP